MLKQAAMLSKNSIINKLAPLSVKISDDLIIDLSDFQRNIPIISIFSNPGLKERHFSEIAQVINYEGELSKKSNLFLTKLLSLGVGRHIQEL